MVVWRFWRKMATMATVSTVTPSGIWMWSVEIKHIQEEQVASNWWCLSCSSTFSDLLQKIFNLVLVFWIFNLRLQPEFIDITWKPVPGSWPTPPYRSALDLSDLTADVGQLRFQNPPEISFFFFFYQTQDFFIVFFCLNNLKHLFLYFSNCISTATLHADEGLVQ